MKTILNYKFTAVPTILSYITSPSVVGYFTYLLSKHNLYFNMNNLDDGYFFLANSVIESDIKISKKKIIQLNETLFRMNLINISCGERRETNRFKINLETLKELDNLTYTDIQQKNIWFDEIKRGEKLTYREQKVEQKVDKTRTNFEPKCHTNINNKDNIYNINKLNNKNNIYNKDNNINNIKFNNNARGANDEIYNKLTEIYKRGKEIKDNSTLTIENKINNIKRLNQELNNIYVNSKDIENSKIFTKVFLYLDKVLDEYQK